MKLHWGMGAMWLSNIVFGIAILTAVLSLLDWLLSKLAKAAISDRAIDVWGWLTYQTSLPYVRVLRTTPAFYVVLLIGWVPLAILIVGLWTATAPGTGPAPEMRAPILGGLAALVLAIYFIIRKRMRALYDWVLSGDLPAWWIARSFGFVIVVFGLVYAATKLSAPITGLAGFTGNITVDLVIWMLLLVATAIVFSIGFGFILIFLLVLLYSLGVILLLGVFRVLELILARIAEYDRGPMTAVVVALTALGTILRTIGT